MSPGLCASDEDLSKFPPTHLMLAQIDFLRDDGIHFMHRLLKNGVDVKATEIELMPHGFLNFWFPFPLRTGMVEAIPCIEKSINIIKSLL